MPTSNKYIITPVIKLVEQIRPKSVLDVGAGFGKWGFLLREYCEVWNWDNALYNDKDKFRWAVKIDGVEICGKYIKDLQRNIYDRIFIGDVFQLIGELDNYDLIILGDVIEHFDKDTGRRLLEKCCDKANKAVIVMTPIVFSPQGDACGNAAERHVSLWTKGDFGPFGKVHASYIKGSLIAVISRIDKRFKFENRYKCAGFLNKFIASMQSKNIKNYGIENSNRGIIMNIYARAQRFRDKRLQALNS